MGWQIFYDGTAGVFAGGVQYAPAIVRVGIIKSRIDMPQQAQIRHSSHPVGLAVPPLASPVLRPGRSIRRNEKSTPLGPHLRAPS